MGEIGKENRVGNQKYEIKVRSAYILFIHILYLNLNVFNFTATPQYSDTTITAPLLVW